MIRLTQLSQLKKAMAATVHHNSVVDCEKNISGVYKVEHSKGLEMRKKIKWWKKRRNKILKIVHLAVPKASI